MTFSPLSKKVILCTTSVNDQLTPNPHRNKRLLFDGIDALTDHQIANYGQALEFAYEEFERFEREKDAQVCVVCLPRREIGQNGLSLRERRESKMNLNK